MELYPEHISNITLPVNLKEEDLYIFEHETSNLINATTLEVLENVEILGDSIFDLNKLKFYRKNIHLFDITIIQKIKRLLLFFKRPEFFYKAIWVIDTWNSEYFHWLTDSLPRFIATEKYYKKHLILLPNEYKEKPYIKESLDFLNVQYAYFNPRVRNHVAQLLLPSQTAHPGFYNTHYINKLRDAFKVPTALESKGKKIFISRQKAPKRKITNESEIHEILLKYGYELHFFEDYNFEKQVNLMNQASHIISLHGAGLTNMLFMPKGAKVLEFRIKESFYNNCYFMLASSLGHSYYYLISKGDSTDLHFANITIDIEKLIQILDNMN